MRVMGKLSDTCSFRAMTIPNTPYTLKSCLYIVWNKLRVSLASEVFEEKNFTDDGRFFFMQIRNKCNIHNFSRISVI